MKPTPNLFTGRYSEIRLESFIEPPYAEPHVRWCGGWAGKPARLPDFGRFAGRLVLIRRLYFSHAGSWHPSISGPKRYRMYSAFDTLVPLGSQYLYFLKMVRQTNGPP
jgi:hypothetical protein